MKLKPLAASIGLTILGFATNATSFAETRTELNRGVAKTLKHLYALNSANQDLADKAAGILIFPRVTKGGAGISGEFGEGVLQLKGKTINYYSIASISLDPPPGVGQHSEVIMFMTRKSLENFRNSDGWSVGADTAVVVVPDGVGSQYDNAITGKPILGFVFGEKGLLGDASLEGSKITMIKEAG